MTLRTRIATTAAVAVALALVIVSVAVYASTARALAAELDDGLRRFAQDLTVRPSRDDPRLGAVPGSLGGHGGFVQAVTAGGRVLGARGDQPRLPVDDATRRVARGEAAPFFSTAELQAPGTTEESIPVRVYTTPIRAQGAPLALQVARPLQAAHETLQALRRRLVVLGLAGVGIAGLLGYAVARRAVGPVRALTGVAEEVAATGDLTRRIDTAHLADDELGRLARTFNTMLDRLARSAAAQAQLVADASHELRTPLTSLRTNIEVLAAEDEAAASDAARLSVAERRGLLGDLVVQLEEFGRLVDALVELARGSQPMSRGTLVALDEVADAAVDRARARSGRAAAITLDASPVQVIGDADDLDRALSNLLDNALKYGLPAATGQPEEPGHIAVQVGTRGDRGFVAVRDHGPGIDPADLPHVFDRFYRAPAARSAPGSGLGLAITDQILTRHGGSVTAAAAAGGGAVFTMWLPLAPSASAHGDRDTDEPAVTPSGGGHRRPVAD